MGPFETHPRHGELVELGTVRGELWIGIRSRYAPQTLRNGGDWQRRSRGGHDLVIWDRATAEVIVANRGLTGSALLATEYGVHDDNDEDPPPPLSSSSSSSVVGWWWSVLRSRWWELGSDGKPNRDNDQRLPNECTGCRAFHIPSSLLGKSHGRKYIQQGHSGMVRG